MTSWNDALRDGALAGSLASLLSTAVLLAAGQRQDAQPTGPVNAISHWVWGDGALSKNGASLRHTALGYLIHHAASLFWSTLHAWAFSGPRRSVRPAGALAQAAATAAVACFVDYRLTPHRLTPGFEHRLTRPQLTGVYACFALGLALGTLITARRR